MRQDHSLNAVVSGAPNGGHVGRERWAWIHDPVLDDVRVRPVEGQRRWVRRADPNDPVGIGIVDWHTPGF